MSAGAWACRACVNKAGASTVGLPNFCGRGFCGAGDHVVQADGENATLWWFDDWESVAEEPLPSVTEMIAATEAQAPRRRGRYAAVEKQGQLSFWEQL